MAAEYGRTEERVHRLQRELQDVRVQRWPLTLPPHHPVFSLCGRSSRARLATQWGRRRPSRAYIRLSYHALSPHPLPDVRTYPRGQNLQPVAPTPPRTFALHRRYSSLSPLTPCSTPTKHQYDPTIEDQYQKTLEVDGKARHVEILDTAGQDEYVRRRERGVGEKNAPRLRRRGHALARFSVSRRVYAKPRKDLLRLRARADHVRAPPGVPNAWPKDTT